MSRLISIQFRGEEQDVEVVRDSGYEPDTGAHEIEWHFYGLTAEQHDALKMTAEEETNVCDQLAEILSDTSRFDDDVI
ncbi:MAG: hypothetical protein C0483_18445 [Pirellula sp.]|nr:hypothetical protein [Pirellula sp.]